MLKCSTCTHRKTIPGDAHVSCARPSTGIINANQTGIQSGWFMFPLNFDPIWAEDCTGYTDKNQNLQDLSKEELIKVFYTEFSLIKHFMDTKFKHVASFLMPKILSNLKIAQNKFKGKNIDEVTTIELIDIIKSFQAV